MLSTEPAVPRRFAWSALGCVGVVVLVAVGCGGSSPGSANPFLAADRVPPPLLKQAAPPVAADSYYGVAPAYPAQAGYGSAPMAGAAPHGQPAAAPGSFGAGYPATPRVSTPMPLAPGTGAPVYGTPAVSLAPPTYGSPSPGSAPGFGTPTPSTPGSAGPYGSTSGPVGGLSGDAVAVANDNASLRFASPDAARIARAEAAPTRTRVAQAAPPTRVAANNWVAGSAPVRSAPGQQLAAGGTRVRLPNASAVTRETAPLSLAALEPSAGGGVRETPLEPSPFRPIDGANGSAPLRVATPPASNGWR